MAQRKFFRRQGLPLWCCSSLIVGRGGGGAAAVDDNADATSKRLKPLLLGTIVRINDVCFLRALVWCSVAMRLTCPLQPSHERNKQSCVVETVMKGGWYSLQFKSGDILKLVQLERTVPKLPLTLLQVQARPVRAHGISSAEGACCCPTHPIQRGRAAPPCPLEQGHIMAQGPGQPP